MQVSDLLKLQRTPDSDVVLSIAGRQRQGRWMVQPVVTRGSGHRPGGWWALPQAGCRDAPDQYHPKYLMAVLTTTEPGAGVNHPGARAVPEIHFGTEASVRRSMTLNGMRMTMEYFQTDSLRILQLVRQRLEAGQRDVVHDVLVYLAQHLADLREHERETRLLRAESVAAYLGLHQPAVNELFLASRLDPAHLTDRISGGAAGPLRRKLDVAALVHSQVALLRPALQEHRRDERRALALLDQIMTLLRSDTHSV